MDPQGITEEPQDRTAWWIGKDVESAPREPDGGRS